MSPPKIFHAEPSGDCWRIFCDGKPVLFLTEQSFYTPAHKLAEQLALVASIVAGLSAYETSKGTP